jgi:hypothetical protein
LAIIGYSFAAAFGSAALLVTQVASKETEQVYANLYRCSGSTDFSVGLIIGTYFVFPAAMAFLLGVCGPILYSVILHRNAAGIIPVNGGEKMCRMAA